MKYTFKKTIVVDLGGSIVFPNEINMEFLREFTKLITRFSKKHKFLIIMGGGKLARNYQQTAEKIRPLSTKEKDWLGIYATRANAKLVQTVFGKIADTQIIDSREGAKKLKKLRKPITVGAGWTPGWSTDYVSAELAHIYGAREIIVAGKPSHVYEKNPDIHTNAKRFDEMTWKEYWGIVPNKKWSSGAQAPIDPVAAKFCRAHKINAIVINAGNLKNTEHLLMGKDFEGTIIQ
ncbi:MAG: UMP kinase [Patescibacteria group bacterium]